MTLILLAQVLLQLADPAALRSSTAAQVAPTGTTSVVARDAAAVVSPTTDAERSPSRQVLYATLAERLSTAVQTYAKLDKQQRAVGHYDSDTFFGLRMSVIRGMLHDGKLTEAGAALDKLEKDMALLTKGKR